MEWIDSKIKPKFAGWYFGWYYNKNGMKESDICFFDEIWNPGLDPSRLEKILGWCEINIPKPP